MGHQSPHYLKLKGKTYYFSRRVPKELQKHSKCSRFEICLRTSVKSVAIKQALFLAQELEDQWSILRRRERNDRIARIFGSEVMSSSALNSEVGRGPTLTEGLEVYLRLKGDGRPVTFETGARRSIGYLLEVSEDKAVDTYDRKDANALREYLKGRGLAKESIARNMTNVRAVINFVLREHGLPTNSAFSGVYLGEVGIPKKRYVPAALELRKLQELCRVEDDELRWILGIIINTGMRLSEAVGLSKDDLSLSSDIPYLKVTPQPWRRLKTIGSERVIPLVGVSLWAAQRASEASKTQFVFPKYCNENKASSNSASAALNKWLQRKINSEIVVHSLRHMMRDRLRNIECPSNVIDAIGGWTYGSVGESYGLGYSLKVKSKWLRISSNDHLVCT